MKKILVADVPQMDVRYAVALALTVKALAANEFMDLPNFGDDEAGNAALRETVGRLLKA